MLRYYPENPDVFEGIGILIYNRNHALEML